MAPAADYEDFQQAWDMPEEFLESWFQTVNNCCLRPSSADVLHLDEKVGLGCRKIAAFLKSDG